MKPRCGYSRQLLTALLLAGLFTLLSGSAFGQGLKITMSTKLFPDFNQDISDYIVAAGSDATLTVTVDAPKGYMVSVDGQAFAGGKFDAKLTNVSPGQSFKMQAWVRRGFIGCGELRTYYVRRVPKDFPTWTTVRPGIPQSEFYVFAPNLFAGHPWVIVADNFGVPIWWYRSDGYPVDPKFLAKDRIGWMNFGPGEEHNIDGTLTHRYFPAGSVGGYVDPHELLQLPNGNYVYIIAVWRGPYDLRPYGGLNGTNILDNVIEEVAPDGSLVWSWSTLDNSSVEETDPNWRFLLNSQGIDPYHMNSVEVFGDTWVISQRHWNALIAIDRKTGKRLWKLGGTPRPESLTFVGDKFNNFGGNHDARVLADGTVTLHDNGTTQNRPPRGARYRLDLVARTATLVEQVMDSNAPYSGFTGSARKLDGGNWVAQWGGNGFFTELTAAGVPVFRLSMTDGTFSYRCAPVAYGKILKKDLRNAMSFQFPR